MSKHTSSSARCVAILIGSVRRAARHTDRVVAGCRSARSTGPVPSLALVGETVDALLKRAVLRTTREASSMSVGLEATRPLGISLRFVSSICGRRLGRCWSCRCHGSGFDADRERTAASAARLSLRVEKFLGLSLALLLLQAPLLDQRRTHDAAALFADPTAVVGNLRFRQLGFGLVREGVLPVAVWRLEVLILTHRGPEYRRIRANPSRVTVQDLVWSTLDRRAHGRSRPTSGQ